MLLKYADRVITSLRTKNKFFFEFFNFAVFITYAGIILSLSAFIYFTFNDIYIEEIPQIYKIFIAFWLFCLYFYYISELRFRIVQLANLRDKTNLYNKLTFILSFILSTISVAGL
ncbi:MAG: hypothetical protein Ta2D_04400 [Rickettsiales bacterium]|nr:MAG: hypothetical protein Ta2D_04400 [Rickettsiales bacterium]